MKRALAIFSAASVSLIWISASSGPGYDLKKTVSTDVANYPLAELDGWVSRQAPGRQLQSEQSSKSAWIAHFRSLLIQRASVGRDAKLNLEERRRLLGRLTLELEESVYAFNQRFPDAREPITIRIAEKDSCRMRYGSLSLCNGDVIISRGNPFASLIFLMRAKNSGLFSHSQVAFEDPNQPERALFIESDLPGAVLDSQRENTHFLSAQYRSKLSPEQKTNLRKTMLDYVQLKKLPQGDFALKLQDFNYRFDPVCAPERSFCTELAYCLYHQAKLPEQLNPFPKANWSPVTEPIFEFVGWLGDEAAWGSAPAPMDIELNPDFEAVAYEIQPARATANRIHLAIAAAYQQAIERDSAFRVSYRNFFAILGEKHLSQIHKDRLLKLISFFSSENPVADRLLLSPPEDFKLKELLYFIHMNMVLLPGTRTALENWVTKQNGPIPYSALQRQAELEIRAQVARLLDQRLKLRLASLIL